MNPSSTRSFSAPKGTYDILPADSARWLEVRRGLLEPARLAGYSYLETPVFEDTALFERGVGESTDVVTKEMYTFSDKGDRSLTLRPEATASIVRAVAEHRLGQGQLPLKVWFAGPMFRYEQPQAGRFRQFQQIDVEALGSRRSGARRGGRRPRVTRVSGHRAGAGRAAADEPRRSAVPARVHREAARVPAQFALAGRGDPPPRRAKPAAGTGRQASRGHRDGRRRAADG